MKKILTWGLCVIMLISVFSVCAFAEDSQAPAGWKKFGDITIDYDSELSSKITFDGQFSDWTAAGIKSNDIDQLNMQEWQGKMADDLSIVTYFAADSEYLYIAFNITDSTKAAMAADETTGSYGGDAFQIQLDFNQKFAAEEEFDRAIFYSFGRREDGQMVVTVNESEVNDGPYWANETDEESGKVFVKGACTELENGWGAELALSWQMLYNHAFDKLDDWGIDTDDFTFELGPDKPITIGALVCYLDRNVKEDGSFDLLSASATIAEYGQMNDQQTGFYPENAGIVLKVIANENADISVDTKEQITDAPTEAPTDPSENESGSEKNSEDATDDETEAPTSGGTSATTGESEKTGCKSAAGIGAIALACSLGTAIVIKKKK